MWERFAESGLQLVAASAFKGATDADEIWADVPRHVKNHLAWMERARNTAFTGIILTGWSRYNHTACLCETLPAGTPSLIACLETIKGASSVEAAWRLAAPRLSLPPDAIPGSDRLPTDALPDAGFPGAAVWSVNGRLTRARSALWHARNRLKTYHPACNGGRINLYELHNAADFAQKALNALAGAEDALIKAADDILYPQDVKEIIGANVVYVRKEAERARELAESAIAP